MPGTPRPLVLVGVVTAALWGGGFAFWKGQLAPTPLSAATQTEAKTKDEVYLFNEDKKLLRSGNPDVPKVALTIDDGPIPSATPKILEALRQNRAQATFFLVGSRIKEYPYLAREIVRQGHEVGNHTMTHPRLPELNRGQILLELQGCEKEFRDATGHSMQLFRPPGMKLSDEVLGAAKSEGYITVDWTHACKDFATEDDALQITPSEIKSRLFKNLKNGSILLLHNTPQTAEALPDVLAELRVMGYEVVSVRELLSYLPRPIQIPLN
jgi:peptidoglycan-N-acetylglucosamine deacetylase